MSHSRLQNLIRPKIMDNYRKAKLSETIQELLVTPPEDNESIVVTSRREELLSKVVSTRYPLNKINVTKDFPEKIPLIDSLERASIEIIARGAELEGIFRLTKSLPRIEGLKKAILLGQPVEFEEEDPYDLASVLKVFIKTAFPNLLDEKSIQQIVTTGDANEYLRSLPKDHRQFLGLLGRTCRAIDANKHLNRMDLMNLARVLAPNLFQHDDPLVELRLINPTIEATRLILYCA